MFLTHKGPLTHVSVILHNIGIGVNELGNHWFRKWLSSPSHYLNQLISYCQLALSASVKFWSKSMSFHEMHLKCSLQNVWYFLPTPATYLLRYQVPQWQCANYYKTSVCVMNIWLWDTTRFWYTYHDALLTPTNVSPNNDITLPSSASLREGPVCGRIRASLPLQWASWHLKSTATWLYAPQLVQANTKENKGFVLLALCGGNPPPSVVSPHKGGSDAERASTAWCLIPKFHLGATFRVVSS